MIVWSRRVSHPFVVIAVSHNHLGDECVVKGTHQMSRKNAEKVLIPVRAADPETPDIIMISTSYRCKART